MALSKRYAVKDLGCLSEKYESGGRGPGTVSSGTGDAGGRSYGLYQFTSKNGGSVKQFIAQSKWADEFEGLAPGSEAFTLKWKQIAAGSPKQFGEAQHAYIHSKYFVPFADKILADTGLDVSLRSHCLRDVVWSTGVQHGPNTGVFRKALAGKDADQLTDAQIIRAVYKERGRKKEDGALYYFSKNSQAVQKGVQARFKKELKDALALLEAETTTTVLAHTTPRTTGPAVASLQTELASTGISVPVDGEYGTVTEDAVKEFQIDEGLEPTGEADGDLLRRAILATPYSAPARGGRQPGRRNGRQPGRRNRRPPGR